MSGVLKSGKTSKQNTPHESSKVSIFIARWRFILNFEFWNRGKVGSRMILLESRQIIDIVRVLEMVYNEIIMYNTSLDFKGFHFASRTIDETLKKAEAKMLLLCRLWHSAVFVKNLTWLGAQALRFLRIGQIQGTCILWNSFRIRSRVFNNNNIILKNYLKQSFFFNSRIMNTQFFTESIKTWFLDLFIGLGIGLIICLIAFVFMIAALTIMLLPFILISFFRKWYYPRRHEMKNRTKEMLTTCKSCQLPQIPELDNDFVWRIMLFDILYFFTPNLFSIF